MKVPLLLYAFDNQINIVTNSKLIKNDLPFHPFLLYLDREGSLQYKLIPTGDNVKVGKREYTTIIEADIASNRLNKENIPHYYQRYNEQLFINNEDYISKYSNNDDLKILYFDIEVSSTGDGLFPRATRDPILSIGSKFNNEEIILFHNFDEDKLDYNIINDFLNYIELKDPDIIVTYNGKSFDIPYLVDRAKINTLDYNKLARFNSNIFNKKNEITIKNRIHFDILEHVLKDQTLHGIKSHKMKEVASWRKIDNIIDLDDHEIKNTKKLFIENKERLLTYLTSDVRILSLLTKSYLDTSISIAEFIKVPLDNIINGYPSFLPKIVCGRHFKKLGHIPLDKNHERYNEQSGKYFQTGFKYQGAIVSIDKTGYFPKVWKTDFSGMYPNAIRTWNIGPDTTKIHEMKDYTGEFLIKRINDVLWLNIPDTNFNKQIIISIDQSKDGFLKNYIKELTSLRKELKIKEKESVGSEKEGYLSRQWAIKIIQNTIYGYMGQEFSNYGDMGSAIAIVGCCRWVTTYVQTLLGDKIIETDTDGLYLNDSVDITKINESITLTIKNQFNIAEPTMQMELDEYDDGYFYRMKNYVLRKDNKIIFHGVSFKSSRHPGIYDKAIEILAKDVLDNKGTMSQTTLSNIRNLNNYELDDFVLRGKINKEPATYDNTNASQCILMDQVEYVLKKQSELGDQIEYFVSIYPAPVPNVLKKLMIKKTSGYNYTITQLIKDRSDLNMEYYSNEIEKVIKLFSGELITDENTEEI